MKKLNLQLGSIKEMLSKEQMKKITGGYEGDCYACECFDDWDGSYLGWVASYHAPNSLNANYHCHNVLCPGSYGTGSGVGVSGYATSVECDFG